LGGVTAIYVIETFEALIIGSKETKGGLSGAAVISDLNVIGDIRFHIFRRVHNLSISEIGVQLGIGKTKFEQNF